MTEYSLLLLPCPVYKPTNNQRTLLSGLLKELPDVLAVSVLHWNFFILKVLQFIIKITNGKQGVSSSATIKTANIL